MNDEEEARGGSGGGEKDPLVHGGGGVGGVGGSGGDASSSRAAPPPGATSSRDAHLDNCKFFLMLVVVFNHCLQDFLDVVLDPTTKRQWCETDDVAPGFYQFIRGVYLYLNLLGMPTFTLISGYCSKGFARSGVHGDGAGLATRSRQEKGGRRACRHSHRHVFETRLHSFIRCILPSSSSVEKNTCLLLLKDFALL